MINAQSLLMTQNPLMADANAQNETTGDFKSLVFENADTIKKDTHPFIHESLKNDISVNKNSQSLLNLPPSELKLFQILSLDKNIDDSSKLIFEGDNTLLDINLESLPLSNFELLGGQAVNNIFDKNIVNLEVNYVEGSDLALKVEFKLFNSTIENSQLFQSLNVGISADNNIEMKLVLWGAVSQGSLSYISIKNLIDEASLKKSIQTAPIQSQNFAANNIIFNKTSEHQTLKNSFANNSSILGQATSLAQAKSSKIKQHSTNNNIFSFLDVTLPQRVMISSEGKHAKIWIRDYLSSINQRNELLNQLLINIQNTEQVVEQVIVNGKKITFDKKGG